MRKHHHPLSIRRLKLRTAILVSMPGFMLLLASGLGGCESSKLRVTPPDGGTGGMAGAAGTGGTRDASFVGGSGGNTGGNGGHSGSGGMAGADANNAGGSPGRGGSGSGGAGGGGVTGSGGITGIGGAKDGGVSTTGGSSAGGTLGGGGAGGGRGGTTGTGGIPGTGGNGSGGTSVGTGGSNGGSDGRGGSGGVGTGGIPGSGGQSSTGGTGGNSIPSSGGTGSGGASTGGSSGASLQGIIAAFCTAARTCCAKAGLSTAVLSDCEAKFPTRRPLISLADLGQATTNPTALAACQAAYTQAASTCTTRQVVTACTGIFVGLQNENQPCGKGGTPSVPGSPACKQNGGPEVCLWTAPDTSDPSVAGICKKMVHGKLGETCVSTCAAGEDCSSDELTSPSDTSVTWCFEADGLYCSYQTTTPSCAALVPVGSSCALDSEACGSANSCDINATCRAKSSLGQSCATNPCARPYICGTSNKCEEENAPFADPDIACQGYAPELL